MDKSKKIAYLDILRMLAVFGVILVHTSAMMVIEYPDTNGIVWKTINIFNGLGRFAVPLFIMISGALLLNEERKFDVKQFYKKQLLWMAGLLCGWVLFYGIFYSVILPSLINEKKSWKIFFDFIVSFKGSDCPHLWYMYMVVGMYLCIPVFRLFVKRDNKKLIQGIIIVSILTQYLPQTMNIVSSLFGFTTSFSTFLDKFHLGAAGGFSGILLTGWYLRTFSLNKKSSILVCTLGLISLVSGIVLTQFLMEKIPGIRAYTYLHFTLLPVITAAGLFQLAKEIWKDKTGTSRFVAGVVDMSMGIYLIHVVYVELFYKMILHYTPGLMNPVLYILLFTITVFIMSFVSSFILSRSQFTRKMIYMKNQK